MPTQVDLSYSFQDVALTGQIYGALCAFGGLLPDAVELDQRPSWEGVDRASITFKGSLRIWLGRALIELLMFLIKRVKWRPPSTRSTSIETAERSYG